MLIIGRMIAGFTAGSQPIAQAAIVDISPAEDKARNIGFILLAVSLGFVLGPIIGGVLSNHNLVSWFGFAVPMYFAAFLSALNALLLSMTFQETFVRTAGKISIQWNHALKIFLAAFQHQGIRRYAVVLLIMIFGWSNYFSFISMYLLQTYHYSTMQNSLFLAVMGIGFSIGCGFLVDFVSKRFHAEHVVTIGLGATAIFVLITLLSPQQWVAWVCSFFIGVSLSVGYSVLLTIFSDQVGENEQGWVMGVTGSIMALCFGLTSVFTGLTAQMGAEMPMLFAFFGLGFSAVLIFFMKGREERA